MQDQDRVGENNLSIEFEVDILPIHDKINSECYGQIISLIRLLVKSILQTVIQKLFYGFEQISTYINNLELERIPQIISYLSQIVENKINSTITKKIELSIFEHKLVELVDIENFVIDQIVPSLQENLKIENFYDFSILSTSTSQHLQTSLFEIHISTNLERIFPRSYSVDLHHLISGQIFFDIMQYLFDDSPKSSFDLSYGVIEILKDFVKWPDASSFYRNFFQIFKILKSKYSGWNKDYKQIISDLIIMLDNHMAQENLEFRNQAIINLGDLIKPVDPILYIEFLKKKYSLRAFASDIFNGANINVTTEIDFNQEIFEYSIDKVENNLRFLVLPKYDNINDTETDMSNDEDHIIIEISLYLVFKYQIDYPDEIDNLDQNAHSLFNKAIENCYIKRIDNQALEECNDLLEALENVISQISEIGI